MSKQIESRIEKLERRVEQRQATTAEEQAQPAEPWWWPFRRGYLWWDDDGRIYVTGFIEYDRDWWQEQVDEMNQYAAENPDVLIVLLTPEEASGALEAIKAGEIAINPSYHTGTHNGVQSDSYYIVKTAWRHPLCSVLDKALHAVNRQRCERLLMDKDNVVEFLQWFIREHETDTAQN